MLRCDVFVQAVRQSVLISIQEFTDDLQHRLRCVWRYVEGADRQGSSNKLATYHALYRFCAWYLPTLVFFFSFLSAQAVSNFLLQVTTSTYFVCLNSWICCWLARTSHRPISWTIWLKVTPCNLLDSMIVHHSWNHLDVAMIIHQIIMMVDHLI